MAMPLATPLGMLEALPRIPFMARRGRITMAQFAQRFRSPLLRQALPTVQYDLPEVPALWHLAFLAGSHNHTLGWPSGGFLAFAQSIADRFTELGGEIHYRSKVVKILVESNRAVGVRLADGSEQRADVVISAVDGHTTLKAASPVRLPSARLDPKCSSWSWASAPDYRGLAQ